MAVTLTVNTDHTASLSSRYLARQGEVGALMTVTVPSAVYALGTYAYIDFIDADGVASYLGDYDASSGTFVVSIGAADNILAKDGVVKIQFVLRDNLISESYTAVWKSQMVDAIVERSVNADTYAIPAAMPSDDPPETYEASRVSLEDVGTHYASNNVEDALQEVGGRLADIDAAEARLSLLEAERGGWIVAGEVWTYASATTFTVAGDVTAKYTKGTKIKLTQTTVKYFYVLSSTYSAPNTIVTITGGTDYTLASAAITSPFYSRESTPAGFPDWFTATAPTFTVATIDDGSGGQPGTQTVKFRVEGGTVHCVLVTSAANVVKAATGVSIAFGKFPTLPDTINVAYTAVGTGWIGTADVPATVRCTSASSFQLFCHASVADNAAIGTTSAAFSYLY